MITLTGDAIIGLIFAIIVLCIFVFVIAYGSGSKRYELNEIHEESRKWKKKYHDEVGKKISQIIKSVDRVVLKDLRSGEDLFSQWNPFDDKIDISYTLDEINIVAKDESAYQLEIDFKTEKEE